MRHRFTPRVLSAALLLSAAGLCLALENTTAVAGPASAAAAAAAAASGAAPRQGAPDTRRKPGAKARLVDINSAARSELRRLPGIGDAQATRIIAGRPYASKSQLVARNIVDGATFDGIRRQIIAGQPYDNAAKNAALYAKKNQQAPSAAQGSR